MYLFCSTLHHFVTIIRKIFGHRIGHLLAGIGQVEPYNRARSGIWFSINQFVINMLSKNECPLFISLPAFSFFSEGGFTRRSLFSEGGFARSGISLLHRLRNWLSKK